MARVYIETSFFSACVTSRQDPITAGWRASSHLWMKSQSVYHDLIISPEVVLELSDPAFKHSTEALELLRGMTVVQLNEEVYALAGWLVESKVMPGPASVGDAVHIAAAIVHRAEFVLSWNVKHLANPNKRTHLNVLCARLGYAAPQIMTPDMLQEVDDE